MKTVQSKGLWQGSLVTFLSKKCRGKSLYCNGDAVNAKLSNCESKNRLKGSCVHIHSHSCLEITLLIAVTAVPCCRAERCPGFVNDAADFLACARVL